MISRKHIFSESTMKMSRFSTLVFLYHVLQRTSCDVIVNTNVGQIRGYIAPDGDYNMFLGIPYAAVNRSNPFGAAIAFPSLEGVFEANNDTAVCPQQEEYNKTLVGTLDCLNLNIYVPTVNLSSKPFAVLMYIYGGLGFGFAKRNVYGPSYFMKQNVILVTFNYRTGPYGFMCLDTPLVPGNQGLKDQTLAIEWVNNNIAAFSGDPNRITLIGHSSGAACVDLHLLSKNAMLYDRAILQSSSSFCPMFRTPNKDAPFLLAEHFGRIFDDVNEAILFLATIDPLQVIQASYDLNIMSTFTQCIEKQFDGIQHFLIEDWLRKKDMPKVKNMNIMMGFTTDEYSLEYTRYIDADGFITLKDVVEDRLVFGFDTEHEGFTGMSKTMQNFYMGDGEINIQMKQQIIDFDSDYTCIHPVHRSLGRFLENDASKVYLYRYGYMGTRNYALYCRNIFNKTKGASHSDELGYLFDMEFLPKPNTFDQLVIDMMTTMWANFAKYGDPTPVVTSLLPVKWLPITNGSQYHYLDINSELSVGSRPYHDRMAFWDLFYKTNYHLQRLYPGAEPAEHEYE